MDLLADGSPLKSKQGNRSVTRQCNVMIVVAHDYCFHRFPTERDGVFEQIKAESLLVRSSFLALTVMLIMVGIVEQERYPRGWEGHSSLM